MDLNLPSFDIRLRRTGNASLQVFDPIRDKYVALTPEEWVRQHFVNYLITEKGYPRSLIANEIALTLNSVPRRCDTVVFDRYCDPMVIIEYKAPSVAITQKVFDQIVRYNMVLHANYLMVSNGLVHYCCEIDYTKGTYSFMKQIPRYGSLSRR